MNIKLLYYSIIYLGIGRSQGSTIQYRTSFHSVALRQIDVCTENAAIPMEVDTEYSTSMEVDEPQAVVSPDLPLQVAQEVDINNLLRVRTISARRLSELMPPPMESVKEESEEEIEKENRKPDENNRV